MEFIEIKNCSKIIGDKVILDSINLNLHKNQIYGFIGRNGSGKTMLFKAILGLLKLSEGEIIIDSHKIETGDSYPVSVGVMIENNNLWSYLTAFDNLKILASIKKSLNDHEIEETIKRVGLDPKSKKTYSKFSLGMKQRLIFAQAIMEKPELLVLDEPTNALDKEGVELFKKTIKQEKERGATILISSHSIEGFNELCDRVFEMEDGRIINSEGNL